MKIFFVLLGAVASGFFPAGTADAQILMSGGTYVQNFDSLASSGSPTWADNVTLPGWYVSKSVAPNNVTTYTPGTGSSGTGALYSFGAAASTERALGSVASGTPGNFAYGVRFANDTALTATNIIISYTGEQWRNGGNTSAQKLAFSYLVVGGPLTNSDAANTQGWTAFNNLDFTTPTTGAASAALDGNNPANQQVFTNVVLAGVVVPPGQEIFLRWFDANDSGNDHALAIDNLTVSFQTVAGGGTTNAYAAPVITLQPQSQATSVGGLAIFSVSATGTPAPNCQWQFNGTNLVGETNFSLALNNVTTNRAGFYAATITNAAGATNSFTAQLLVHSASLATNNGAIRLLSYNVAGNGVADWSTNTAQVQAIGRQLMYLNPDIVTFNEIPTNGVALMPDWIRAFLPGYSLAINSIGDGYIQNCIVSRFPIQRSASHLHASSLSAYGYGGTGFSRDLFEAQISVPDWPQPLHVFVAHLKATTSSNPQDGADKRAAEAAAVSNYFANVFLPSTNGLHPYTLSGDMNEYVFFPETNNYTSGHPIQRLTGATTGLQLATPVNSITHTDLTESIRSGLDTRFDYILPCALLFSNITGSQVFRTDLLTPLPAGLNSSDDATASDHLPVLMTFANPYAQPFRVTTFNRSNNAVNLQWGAVPGGLYRVEGSTNLASWTALVTNLLTTNYNGIFSTNAGEAAKFFRVRTE